MIQYSYMATEAAFYYQCRREKQWLQQRCEDIVIDEMKVLVMSSLEGLDSGLYCTLGMEIYSGY